MKLLLACILGASLLGAAHAGEPDAERRAFEAMKAELLRKLQRQVDFDFVDTPFHMVTDFFRELADVNIIIDPAMVAAGLHETPITLRVQGMPMATALNHITRLNNAVWDIRDNAVFITNKAVPVDAADRQKDKAPEEWEHAKRALLEQQTLKLRVKLADGTEIQASNLNPTSELAEQILDQFTDPASNGLLTFRLPNQLPHGLALDDLKAVIKKVAPAAVVTLEAKVNLLLVSDDDKPALRRVNAVMRELGLRRRMGPPAPPGMGDVMFVQPGARFEVPVPPPPPEPKKR